MLFKRNLLACEQACQVILQKVFINRAVHGKICIKNKLSEPILFLVFVANRQWWFQFSYCKSCLIARRQYILETVKNCGGKSQIILSKKVFSFSARYNQKPEANFKIVFFHCKGIKERLLKNCIQMVVMIDKHLRSQVTSELLLRQTPKKSFCFLNSRLSYKIISNHFNFSLNFTKCVAFSFFFN